MALNPKAYKLKLALEAAGVVVANSLDDVLEAATAFTLAMAAQNAKVEPVVEPASVAEPVVETPKPAPAKPKRAKK